MSCQKHGRSPNSNGIYTDKYKCSGLKRFGCKWKAKVLYTKDHIETHNAARYRLYFGSVEHCHPTAVGQVGSPLASLGKPGIAPEFKADVDRLLMSSLLTVTAATAPSTTRQRCASTALQCLSWLRRPLYPPYPVYFLLIFCATHSLFICKIMQRQSISHNIRLNAWPDKI